MWGVGCVFAEILLHVIKNNSGGNNENSETSEIQNLEKSYLFPGDSCFPLSHDLLEELVIDSNDQFRLSKNDQLMKIMNVLGKQESDNLNFLKDKTSLEYFKDVQSQIVHDQMLDTKF